MANTVSWGPYGTFTTGIDGSGSAPTLKNLSNNGQKIGNAIDNTSAKDVMSDWQLKVRGASSFTAGGWVELYLIPALDGSNYADGDDSVVPSRSLWVGSFGVQAASTQQVLALYGVRISPGKFKPLIINKGGQAFTNTNAENILSYVTYSPQVQ